MIQLGYITLTVVMTGIILYGYNYGLQKTGVGPATRKKRALMVILGLLAWFAYVFVLGKSGFLQSYDLPPRFPLFLVLPAFLFTGIVLFKNRNSPVIAAIPKPWLIYYQSFRIAIESLFVGSVAAGLLHPEVTFEGYNYDIVFAFTAPIVAFLVFNRKVFSERAVLAWNYLGLAIIAFIIFLFTTTIYLPSIWGSTDSLAPLGLTSFEFMLVPAFLMPSAVFMHLVSIIQLQKKR